MKSLFVVTDTHDGKSVSAGFENKQLAKEFRNAQNGADKEAEGKFRYVVSYGKDHRLYNP